MSNQYPIWYSIIMVNISLCIYPNYHAIKDIVHAQQTILIANFQILLILCYGYFNCLLC